MEYLVGILLGIIGVLLFKNKAPFIPSKKDKVLEQLSSEIEQNKKKIKEEEEKLYVKKEEKKPLSDLLEYFKHINK